MAGLASRHVAPLCGDMSLGRVITLVTQPCTTNGRTPVEPPSAPEFIRVLVQVDSRTLIKSLCKRCGAWKLVSHLDESLEMWENTHHCSTVQAENACT